MSGRSKTALLLTGVFVFLSVHPAVADEPPTGYALLPGGQYFYSGDVRTGAAFAVPEIGLLALGISQSGNLGRQDSTPELNVPLLLGAQLYVVDKWGYYQKRMLRLKDENPGFGPPVDRTPLGDLMLAPFKPEVMSSPLVIVSALLGFADGYYGPGKKQGAYSAVSSVTAMNRRMGRDTGTAYYEAASFGVSYGAGVSEEMIFRGMIMPIIDHKYGKTTGLVSSSIGFGVLHSLNPGASGIYLPLQATFMGLLFGLQVQEDDYNISKTIAAHFWYDFVSTTTTWLANPGENPLGVQVRFGF